MGLRGWLLKSLAEGLGCRHVASGKCHGLGHTGQDTMRIMLNVNGSVETIAGKGRLDRSRPLVLTLTVSLLISVLREIPQKRLQRGRPASISAEKSFGFNGWLVRRRCWPICRAYAS